MMGHGYHILSLLFVICCACFQGVDSQAFSPLENCVCTTSECSFSSYISPGSLPWSFNWVMFPDASSTEVIIASITVHTNGTVITTPRIVSDPVTEFRGFTFEVSNTPTEGVLPPVNITSTLTAIIVPGFCELGGLEVGIPTTRSLSCQQTCQTPDGFNVTSPRNLTIPYCGSQSEVVPSEFSCFGSDTLRCPAMSSVESLEIICQESGVFNNTVCPPVADQPLRSDQVAIIVLNVILAVTLCGVSIAVLVLRD